MTDHENDPIDFSILGPPMARGRIDALIAAAARHGEDELQRRRGAIAVVRVVIAWRRPLLAFSGLAAAAAVALFVRSAPVTTIAQNSATPSTIAEALGIPSGLAQSVEGSATAAVKSGKERP